MKDGACRWPVEEAAGMALVCPPMSQSRVEVFGTALKAGHAVRPAHQHQILLACLFCGEFSNERHE